MDLPPQVYGLHMSTPFWANLAVLSISSDIGLVIHIGSADPNNIIVATESLF
jgi:hypothetical protein